MVDLSGAADLEAAEVGVLPPTTRDSVPRQTPFFFLHIKVTPRLD